MWAVAAQPRTGLTPMIPTPNLWSAIARAAVRAGHRAKLRCCLVHGISFPAHGRHGSTAASRCAGLLFGGSGVGAFLLGGVAVLRPQQGRGEDDAGGDETGADAEGEVVPAGQRRRG